MKKQHKILIGIAGAYAFLLCWSLNYNNITIKPGRMPTYIAMKDGKEVKLFLEANPAEHRVNLTNWKGEAQQLEHYKRPEFKQEQKKDQKQDQSQDQSKKKSKGRKMAV
jgi:hypothetical protein